MKTKQTFEESLRKSNLSENTISSYLWTIQYYEEHYDGITKENLLAYKGYLMEYFKPKTVNLRIQAMNKYLREQMEQPEVIVSESEEPVESTTINVEDIEIDSDNELEVVAA